MVANWSNVKGICLSYPEGSYGVITADEYFNQLTPRESAKEFLDDVIKIEMGVKG